MINKEAHELLEKLSKVAKEGLVPAIGHGATTIGMTLLDKLGLPYNSVSKPNYKGIVITAARTPRSGPKNRITLFAKVPNWEISHCKSSREIVEKYGYETGPNDRKLYCTLNARRPNSQGLHLQVNKKDGLLLELAQTGTGTELVAAWSIPALKEHLEKVHPTSMWVIATVHKKDGRELFQYHQATLTVKPRTERLADLLSEGTITIDHLIEKKDGAVREKGPLFRIKPENIEMLFPEPKKFNLLTYS